MAFELSESNTNAVHAGRAANLGQHLREASQVRLDEVGVHTQGIDQPKMATTEQQELIGTFSSVTGADAITARHVLEAHAWDLNNGVEFFLEQGSHPCPPSLQGHPVSIDEEFDQDGDLQGPAAQPVAPTTIALPDSPPVQGRLPVASHLLRQEDDEHDEMLQRVFNHSARPSGRSCFSAF